MRRPLDFDNHPAKFEAGLVRGVCHYVADADTFDIMCDLGQFEYSYKTFRLYGLDTPEIFHPRNPAERAHGMAAKQRAAELILNLPVLIRTYRDTVTFDRFVAEVFYPLPANEKGGFLWQSLADTLRAEGFEKRASYS